MELYIRNRLGELLGVVDEIESLIWTRRYDSPGTFQLTVPLTRGNMELLRHGLIVSRQGDEEAMEIRYIHVSRDASGAERIEAQGSSLLSWLSRRIVLAPLEHTGTAQEQIYELVRRNAISPSDAKRSMPGLSLHSGDASISGAAFRYAPELYIDLLRAVSDIAKSNQLGVRIMSARGSYRLSVYQGRDLSRGNAAGNAPCIFSEAFDNVSQQEYTHSLEFLKTDGYVAGETSQTGQRRIVGVGGGLSGLDRHEVFVDAIDLSQTYTTEAGQTVTLPLSEYEQMLRIRGEDVLRLRREVVKFDAKVDPHAGVQYRTDYDVGDVVTCHNARWGIETAARVVEASEAFEGGKATLDIVFGESTPSLASSLRQILRG